MLCLFYYISYIFNFPIKVISCQLLVTGLRVCRHLALPLWRATGRLYIVQLWTISPGNSSLLWRRHARLKLVRVSHGAWWQIGLLGYLDCSWLCMRESKRWKKKLIIMQKKALRWLKNILYYCLHSWHWFFRGRNQTRDPLSTRDSFHLLKQQGFKD